jgi:predicted phage terminase large subunit-like protein
VSTSLEDPPNTIHLRVPLHDNGPALWPEHIPLLGENGLEQALRDNGTPIFETMFQGRRGGLSGTIIRQEWFRYFDGVPPGVTYMAVDPAISLKTEADETAIAVANVFDGQVAYRWIWHGRVGVKDTEEIIVKAWNYYRPVAIGIEKVAYQAALVQLLEADHPELPIEPVSPDKDKLSRFLSLARLYEFGRVYHHPSMRASAAEYQLTHLPRGRHDDIPDAMTYLVEMAGIATATIVSDERPEGFR